MKKNDNIINSKALVSVIIPTHNRSELLGRAVGSVLQQTYSDFEIIIVDDDSSDDTEDKVSGWCKLEQRIIYIRNEINIGAAAGRNRAVAIAKGKYLCFLDDDDEWYPEKLKRQFSIVPFA